MMTSRENDLLSVNLETCNVHNLFQPCQISYYHLFVISSANTIALSQLNSRLNSMSNIYGMSKDERRCRLCTGNPNT